MTMYLLIEHGWLFPSFWESMAAFTEQGGYGFLEIYEYWVWVLKLNPPWVQDRIKFNNYISRLGLVAIPKYHPQRYEERRMLSPSVILSCYTHNMINIQGFNGP